LRQPLDPRATLSPFGFEKTTTTVGGSFFDARGLGEHEPAESGQHLRQPGFQTLEKMCGQIYLEHRPDMLTTRWCSSNHSKWLRRAALDFGAAAGECAYRRWRRSHIIASLQGNGGALQGGCVARRGA
jgi:hypothetical protein